LRVLLTITGKYSQGERFHIGRKRRLKAVLISGVV
jgi:hypothetical protein